MTAPTPDDLRMRVFFEIHDGNPQEGPGDFRTTRDAFRLMTGLPPKPRILDAGCGPGRQTLDLARLTAGPILAVDNHRPYLEFIRRECRHTVFASRIFPVQGDMGALPFRRESFHIIWSEGAVYLIGFRNGLALWKPLLKAGGYVAVTEATWLRPDPPDDLAAFWSEGYPRMQDVAGNLSDLEAAGYRPVGHFTLPESAWWNYYEKIEAKLSTLERKYADTPGALAVLEMERQEIKLYRTYSDYYGYVFYIGQAR